MFRQRPGVQSQGVWGPRGQGLGGYNQGPGGGMGIYQGAGQGYPDTGMGMRGGGYPGGFPDLPFYRGQPPPDYGGYQVSAHGSKMSPGNDCMTCQMGGGREMAGGQYPGRQQFLPQQQVAVNHFGL